ncbi:helix-turn-helix transcriptional regulator [Actinomadura sp. NEAU-AAG7]|uniref:helix-turn-helix domain-containing protein n=1 Tax=Actinomadura sp. NEAU-AAG7 TaxID=2839640 RepID=UPI001BE4DCB2|nr:helix-turn-helix transcriptional regulator [Actinomadura sp. NEAU-AAG7]MBT2207879.1 helix-turn-helix domain-containing protein [Actinomadura sp. NEAU-AAG7]
MYDEVTIGARLRALRRWRGMSLRTLADLADLSQGFLSKVENGKQPLDRRSHIAAVAQALQVSETDLMGGPHLSTDPTQAGPHSVVPALRAAIQTNRLGDAAVDRARPLPDLLAETRELEEVFICCDYLALGRRLPSVIDELHFHIAEPAGEPALLTALTVLVEVYMFATFRTKDLGYSDLAHLAASRAMDAAKLSGDPVAAGKADYLRVQTMPRENSWDRAQIAAEQAAKMLEPHATDPLGIQVLGMLTLSAAMAAAVQHKTAAAGAWLDEARALAARVPDEPLVNWSSFSTTNVGVWGVAVGVESGEGGAAVLELADAVDEAKLSARRSRHATFLADVGRGLARDRNRRGEALRWLRRAEAVAPQRIRNNAAVRETVGVMLQQAREAAVGRELRGMAARMGVPH